MSETTADLMELRQIAAAAAERGEFREAQEAYERAIRSCTLEGGDELFSAALRGDLGDAYLESGDVSGAIDSYKEALSRYHVAQDILGLARCQRRLGTAYRAKGDARRASDAYDEADELLRQVNDDAERALLLTSVGELHEEGGMYHDALGAYREALAIHQAREDEAGVIRCLRLVGSALQELGDLSGAAEHLNRALALLQSKGGQDKPELIEVTNLLGSVLEDQGDLRAALALFQKSLDLARKLELEPARAETLQHMGSAYRHLGEFDDAIEHLERAISIAKGLKDDVALSLLYGDLGEVYLELGDPEKAIKNFKNALYRDQAHQDQLGMAVNQRRLGSAYQEQGEFDRAAEAYDEAESLLLRAQDEGERSILFTQQGALHEVLGQYEKALASYSQALAINEAQRNDVGTIICLRHLGSAHLRLGEVGTAARHLERARVLLEAHNQEDAPELIEVSNLLGAAREANGAIDDALTLYREALEIAEKLEHEPLTAQTLHRIGSADCVKGNFERGRERFEAAMRIWKELDAEVELAEIQGAIGKSYEDERSLDEAVSHYLVGLRIARRLELPPIFVLLALGLARCYRQMHDLERVADVLDEIQDLVDVDSTPLRAEFWREAGWLAEMQERMDDAVEAYERALDVYKSRGDAVGALECQRLLLHASLVSGDSESATDYLLEALALSPDDLRIAWAAMLGQLHPRIADAAVGAFKSGDYWSATAKAFLVCEEMLQARVVGGTSRDRASYLIDAWFQPDQRGILPWIDAEELSGFREFARGAFRAQRNPNAHRSSATGELSETVAWLFVAHLIATFMDQPEDATETMQDPTSGVSP